MAPDEPPRTIQRVDIVAAPFCRMLHLIGPDLEKSVDAELSVLKRSPSRWRPDADRIILNHDAGISATRLGGGSYWISGSYATPDSVLEVTGDGIAPMTVPFDGWEHGPPSLPHFLRVVSPLVAEGQVRTMDEDPVAGALVVVSASVPAPSGSLAEGEREAWRVIAEAVTDEDGVFRVLGLGPGEYEFRALHPNQGRVAVVRTLGAGSFVLRLRPPKLVIGRVVKRGLPASKIPIRVSPELSQFTGTGNPRASCGGRSDRSTRCRFAPTLA